MDVSLPTPECIAEECNKKFVHSGRPSLVYESALGLYPDSLIPEDRRDPNSKPRSQWAFPGCSPYTVPWAVLDTMRYQSPILEEGRCDGRHYTWVPVRQGSWQSITMPANLKFCTDKERTENYASKPEVLYWQGANREILGREHR